MRRCLMSVVMVVALTGSVPASQVAAPSMKACDVLTKDLVEPFTENKRMLDALKPDEETDGNTSACEYGVVRLQLAPYREGANRAAPKDSETVPGLGDTAFFRSNRDRYAELMVWSRSYQLGLQVAVPTGSTAAAIKPKTLALATAILQKLR